MRLLPPARLLVILSVCWLSELHDTSGVIPTMYQLSEPTDSQSRHTGLQRTTISFPTGAQQKHWPREAGPKHRSNGYKHASNRHPPQQWRLDTGQARQLLLSQTPKGRGLGRERSVRIRISQPTKTTSSKIVQGFEPNKVLHEDIQSQPCKDSRRKKLQALTILLVITSGT